MKALPCPPERWPRFSELLDRVLALDPPQRAAWLDALSDADADLRPALASLLDLDQRPSTREWLERPALSAADDDAGFAAGQRVGPWQLRRLIGSGGMGGVWLAARADGAYEREIALKLPHAHLLAGSVATRFARERNILAGLAHPHVARFYDAGLSAEGQPWLALEYVEGQAITAHCDAHALGIAARIGLMLQVASAVQAAHARLIVHRDLKPANVLVTAQGQVKLLDFGIAKLVDVEAADAPLTQFGGRAATPDYAAPEQLAGDTITVATDVYALGVMLYELLAGARPFAPRSRLAQMIEVREDPPPASSRASDRKRRAALAGDLDAILGKALERDPLQRYASVEAFAADLQRYLADQPVLARRASRWQRTRKFMRRHRRGIALASVFALVLTAGVAGVLWQSARTAEQARRAEITKDFLVGVFQASDPRTASERPRGQMPVRELLDLSIARIETELASEPELQIELLGVMGYALGLSPEPEDEERFEQVTNRRLDIALKHFGERHPVVIETKVLEAWGEIYYQNYPAAQAYLKHADRMIDAAGLNRHRWRAEWWLAWGRTLRGTAGASTERVEAFRRSAQLYRRYAADKSEYAAAVANVATELLYDGQFEQAEAEANQAIALFESRAERDDLSHATAIATLGLAQQMQGKIAQAEASYRKATTMAVQTAGKHYGTYWMVLSRHAGLLHRLGDRAGAAALFDEVQRSIPADWHKTTDDTQFRETLAASWLAEGRAAQALPLLEAAEKVYAQRAPTEFDLRRLRLSLGQAYAAVGRVGEARERLRLARDDYVAHARGDHPDRLAAQEIWARFLLAQGDIDSAAAELQQARSLAKDSRQEPAVLIEAGLARVALARGDVVAARTLAERALKQWQIAAGTRQVRTQAYLQRVLADAMAAGGDPAAAQLLEDQAAAGSARHDAADSETLKRRTFMR